MSKKSNNKNSTTNSINTRAYALNVIVEVMENGAYSDKALHDILDSGTIKDKRDRAFVSRLCEGVVERAITLDYIIECYSSVKVKKMKPVVRNTLRMSVYQIFYMESVPDSAACDEAVKLIVKRGYKGLSGFVNGVLRNIIRNKDSIKYPSLSVKYSMPEWIVDRFSSEYGKDTTEKILDAFLNKSKSTCVRCNISKADIATITEMLKTEGVETDSGKFLNMH